MTVTLVSQSMVLVDTEVIPKIHAVDAFKFKFKIMKLLIMILLYKELIQEVMYTITKSIYQ